MNYNDTTLILRKGEPDELETLRAEVEGLREDKECLDWIEREKADVFETHGKWFIAFGQPAKTEAETLRAAINAAMAQGGAK